MNLVTNASEAIGDRRGRDPSPTGAGAGRRVPAARLPGPGLPPGRYVFLEVADTGCGMAPEVLARIFDPFFTTKGTGRGLGLSAIWASCAGHGAGIEIRSEPGGGTTFKLLFPAIQAGAARRARPAPSPRRPAPLRAGAAGGRRGRSSGTIGRGPWPAWVSRCSWPGTAWRPWSCSQAHQDDSDLVIMDLTMPRMDGPRPSADARRPDLPVILTSGYSEQEAVRPASRTRAGGVPAEAVPGLVLHRSREARPGAGSAEASVKVARNIWSPTLNHDPGSMDGKAFCRG